MNCSVLSIMPSSAIVVTNSSIFPQKNLTSKKKLRHINNNNITSATRPMANYTQNPKLHTLVFNQTIINNITKESSVPEEQIPFGTFIQPFGSTIVVDQHSFRILAYSENTPDMLDIAPKPFTLIATDVRSLFTHPTSLLLEKTFKTNLTNPTLILSRTSGKTFHGILHRINAGIVIDLEPAISFADADTVKDIKPLPSSDNVEFLYDTVVESVRELTGYDRVMVYKFHEDYHGEVVAESKRSDLMPFIGLHFPATDIPEASRVLLKKNRVRMIVDCNASGVKVVEDESVCLVGSTLRAPHGCHAEYMANMGCVASMVMAVVVNGNDDEDGMKLWGLVICHHGSPKCVSFPLRRACESLVQDFAERLNVEKRVLKMQSMQFQDLVSGELSLRVPQYSAMCMR